MPLKIAISGSSGLIGTAISNYFKQHNAEIIPIVRSKTVSSSEKTIVMDVGTQTIDLQNLEGVDAVIHLGGANLADRRWTKAYKSEILSSRVMTTKIISEALTKLKNPPQVFISASAIGWYGNTHEDKKFVETDPPVNDFLGTVCQQWEASTQSAKNKGIRVVNLRTGAVLSKKGGALKKMWIPFILGLGGKLGNGKQMFSWIALNEIPYIIDFIIQNKNIAGPLNMTSPNPVTNAEFTKIFGHVIKRPTIFPVPAFGARLLFGEMADALLLNGAAVIPKKLQENGYTFKYGQLADALYACL